MTLKATAGPLIGFATALGAMISVLLWRQTIMVGNLPGDPQAERWQHVMEEHPMPNEPATSAQLSAETFEAILRANPFSSQRRLVPLQSDDATGSNSEAGAGQPPAPQFLYKGRINLGNLQRAILEETVTHKTHFLEVGQEVTGFKVLDIAENQVVLSHLQSKEELVISLTAAGRKGMP